MCERERERQREREIWDMGGYGWDMGQKEGGTSKRERERDSSIFYTTPCSRVIFLKINMISRVPLLLHGSPLPVSKSPDSWTQGRLFQI